MTSSSIVARGLDQLGQLVATTEPTQLDAPTPCENWTVRDLIDHVTQTTAQFAALARGEDVDWNAPTPHHDDAAQAYRQNADELIAVFADGQVPEGMPSAELGVHAWDLATALGRDTGALDPEVAEVGLEFMTQNLTPDRRGDAFGPQQQAPDGANAYERLAAFAGRQI